MRSFDWIEVGRAVPGTGFDSDHGLVQIFRAGLSSAVAKSNRMPSTIVFHHNRMVHGDISRALLEISHRIGARLHRVRDQAVSLGYGALGVVNKTALNIIPAIEET